MKVKILSEHAILPTRGSSLAAGLDLYAAHDSIVYARGRELIRTDLAVAVPKGTYGRVAPRSGLAYKHGIDVGAGVIDEDYTGNVGVILFNHSETDFKVLKGDRIAQLIIEKIEYVDIVHVRDLAETHRGTNGFGSTGTGMEVEDKNSVEHQAFCLYASSRNEKISNPYTRSNWLALSDAQRNSFVLEAAKNIEYLNKMRSFDSGC
jgi:deoxyuridine 5'-triphosphate nucleotidohydrolase